MKSLIFVCTAILCTAIGFLGGEKYGIRHYQSELFSIEDAAKIPSKGPYNCLVSSGNWSYIILPEDIDVVPKDSNNPDTLIAYKSGDTLIVDFKSQSLLGVLSKYKEDIPDTIDPN